MRSDTIQRSAPVRVRLLAIEAQRVSEMFPAVPPIAVAGHVFVVVRDDGLPLLVTATRQEALRQIGKQPHVELVHLN